MKREANEKPRKGLTKVIFATVLCVSLIGCLAACAPAANKASDSESSEADTTEVSLPGNFLNNGAGDFPDDDRAIYNINDANRGCNACHEDLWDKVNAVSQLPQHLASSNPGYDRGATILDCYGCHLGIKIYGPRFGDSIHAYHMSDETFVNEMNGNCFSCHALDTDKNLVLYDVWKYTVDSTGYVDASPAIIDWVAARGWPTSTMNGITLEREMSIASAEFDQEASDPADDFCASNLDVPQINADEWTLNVTGVKNPRAFTLEELYELPQTTKTICRECAANPTASYQVANVPVTGVLIEDIIEACGGLVSDDITVMTGTFADDWGYPDFHLGLGTSYDLETLLYDGAMIALEEWGEPLSPENGYPAAICWPGCFAAWDHKWVTDLEFCPDKEEGVMVLTSPFTMGFYPNLPTSPNTEIKLDATSPLNTGWLNPVNDGEVLTMENGKVELEGWAWTYSTLDEHYTTKIAFSADYGTNWTEVEIDLENCDPDAWVHWVVEWEPPSAGTYVLYSSAIDNHGHWQYQPSPIIVTVE